MGIILGICGLGVYQAMADAGRVALNRELESIAGTLHDDIEPTLKQPGQLEPNTQQLLPICFTVAKCPSQMAAAKRHILGAINQSNFYYVRFFDRSGHLIAIAGVHPEGLSPIFDQKLQQTLFDREGNRYRQTSLSLHTYNYIPWGYMQVGRSLKEFDDYLAKLRWILGLGLPMAMALVAVSGWWLAELAMQPIRQSYQKMQQFTADAAHEFRTPLAVLQATVESIFPMLELHSDRNVETFAPTDKFDERLFSSDVEVQPQQIIERQIARLSQLVKDLLLLSRMEQQVLSVQKQPCCLNDLINDLVEEFEDLAKAAGVNLSTNVRLQELLYVAGDLEQLYCLVSNLIVNAIQYTLPEGRVTVILDSSHQYALVQVQDTGIGIAPVNRDRIFERFYRVNGDRSRSTGGSGLGLAIAMAIAQAHGGSLQLKSQLGKGSTFTIQLPLVTDKTKSFNLPTPKHY